MLRGRKCRAPNQCSSIQLAPPHSRAFFIGEAMNDIDVGHSLVPSRDTQSLQEEETLLAARSPMKIMRE
jgi:hypothetical protein